METGALFEIESTQPTRDGLKEFVFHELKHGAEVLPVFRELASVARDRASSPSKVQPEAKGGR
jgi:hypothetical protein